MGKVIPFRSRKPSPSAAPIPKAQTYRYQPGFSDFMESVSSIGLKAGIVVAALGITGYYAVNAFIDNTMWIKQPLMAQEIKDNPDAQKELGKRISAFATRNRGLYMREENAGMLAVRHVLNGSQYHPGVSAHPVDRHLKGAFEKAGSHLTDSLRPNSLGDDQGIRIENEKDLITGDLVLFEDTHQGITPRNDDGEITDICIYAESKQAFCHTKEKGLHKTELASFHPDSKKIFLRLNAGQFDRKNPS